MFAILAFGSGGNLHDLWTVQIFFSLGLWGPLDCGGPRHLPSRPMLKDGSASHSKHWNSKIIDGASEAAGIAHAVASPWMPVLSGSPN